MEKKLKEKILIITYYWPPSGGAGVQRWLKLSKYLARLGYEIHVLSVDPNKASYFQRDESLSKDIHPDIKVHLTNSFEPLSIYAKIIGKSNVPTAGFSNVDGEKWHQKKISQIRSNLFIPDPRIGWKKHALKKAKELIEKEGIKNIITTSPPHSVQLIGLALKNQLKEKINWIVDFRDPWTDIYYYPLLHNSKYSHNKNLILERETIENSDKIITVSEGFKSLFLEKTSAIVKEKINVISNGFDPDDFKAKGEVDLSKSTFVVSYIGTVADNYQSEVFFDALGRLVKDYPDTSIQFRATGVISENLQRYICGKIGDRAIFNTPVPHDDAVKAMRASHVLLLISPPTKGIVPGKAFEYIASGRRIVCLGKGDSGEVIEKCKAGKSFSRDEEDEIYKYLVAAYKEFIDGIPFQSDQEELKKHAWDYKAKLISELF